MKTNLIKITEKDGNKAVSARELHSFLEATERFSNWINRQFQYGFIENVDYVGCKEFNTLANQELNDYALTIDCAKEISMLQKSEKGKQARRYFIECEKAFKNRAAIDFNNPDTVLKLAQNWKEEQEKRLQAEQTIKEQAPKVLFATAVEGSQSSCLIGELAKILRQNGIEMGQNRLFKWMRDNKYLGSFGERKNIPMQRYIEQGLFILKKGVRSGSGGEMHTTLTPKVTGKGQSYFINKFLNVAIS